MSSRSPAAPCRRPSWIELRSRLRQRAAGQVHRRRDDLPAGFGDHGPAIVEEYGSTTVVEDGFSVEMDRLANLVLRPEPKVGG
jgi:N-methylhydantoinase A